MVPYMVIDAISNNVIYQVVPKHENLLLKYLVGITKQHYIANDYFNYIITSSAITFHLLNN